MILIRSEVRTRWMMGQGAVEEGCHLGSGYGLAGAVAEGVVGASFGDICCFEGFGGSDDAVGLVCHVGEVSLDGGGRGDEFEGAGEHFGHVGSGDHSAGVELSVRCSHHVGGDGPRGVAPVPGVFFYVDQGRSGNRGGSSRLAGDGPVQEGGHLASGDGVTGAEVVVSASVGDAPAGDVLDGPSVAAVFIVAECGPHPIL